jgi:hypothetical protein
VLAGTIRTLVLGAAGLACALAAGGCGGSRQPQNTSTMRPSLESIFQADIALRADPAGTLDTLRGLGVSRVKVDMAWRAIAPTATTARAPKGFRADDPAAYPATAWAPYDTILREARKRDMQIDLTLGPPAPDWATGPGAPAGGPAGAWKPSAAAFGRFVRAVGRRYSGAYTPPGSASALPRVDFWGVWNEPNYGPSLAPQAIGSAVEIAPALYRGIVDATWAALGASGHGSDTILIGELAPRGQTVAGQPGNFSGMVPLRFVRALYCTDAALQPLRGAAASARGCPATAAGSRAFPAQHPGLFHASGFSVHPYPQGRTPPNLSTAIEPDYADLAAVPNLERTLDRVAAAYGSRTRFPIYSTEFGYKTDPPYPQGAALQTAALYLNWSEYLSWRDPRIRSYHQYLLVDPPADSHSSFDTGLEFADGRPKPTFAAYRMPLFLPVARAGAHHGLEVWGCVRPAAYARHDTGREQVASIEFARSPSGPFTVLKRVPIADSHGYFLVSVTFPASGVVRVSWSPPHGPVAHSRLASVTIG